MWRRSLIFDSASHAYPYNSGFRDLYSLFSVDVFHFIDDFLGFGSEFNEIFICGFCFIIGMSVISPHFIIIIYGREEEGNR